MNKLDQKLEKSQKDTMIVLIAVIGVVVVAIGVVVGVVKKTMAHRQVAPDVELKEDNVDLTFE
jgi:type III secretory pathway component EscR